MEKRCKNLPIAEIKSDNTDLMFAAGKSLFVVLACRPTVCFEISQSPIVGRRFEYLNFYVFGSDASAVLTNHEEELKEKKKRKNYS